MDTPDELLYSSDHEWVRKETDNRIRVGITDFAQDALGDIVYVELPVVGTIAELNKSISEVESTKSVSDIYAPLPGTIIEVNEDLNEAPEKINSDPYGDGWLFVLELTQDQSLDSLLDSKSYLDLTEA